MVDKKHHKPHYDDGEVSSNKVKKQLKRQIEENDLGLDEEEDHELYYEVMRFLK